MSRLVPATQSTTRPMPSEIDVRICDGELPPFWDDSVAFVANLLALFFGNENETDCLSKQVGEIDSYGGRLIPILNILFRGGNNLLILERRPDETLCEYFANDLGLDLPEIEILTHANYVNAGRAASAGDADQANHFLGQVAGCTPSRMDGYVTDETLHKIAQHLGKQTVTTPEGSHRGNNKYLLHQFLCEAGLPHFTTVMADAAKDVPTAVKELSGKGYRSAVLKSQIGASGIGIMKLSSIDDENALPEIPEHYFYEGAAMVQGWLEPGIQNITNILSPSVQMFLDESSVYLFDLTEQILSSQSIHEGNESPPRYLDSMPSVRDELLRQASQAGRWLHSVGYRGTASTDFLVVQKDDNSFEVYVCEINARVTGATYPSILANHFHPSGAWLLRNIRIHDPISGKALIGKMNQASHLYRSGVTSGVLPLNFNFGAGDLVQKGQFLAIGDSLDHCHASLEAMVDDLPIGWQFERD